MSYNKLIIAGRLTRDPEVRPTHTGPSVVNCAVVYELGSGERRHSVVLEIKAFGKSAEGMGRHFSKGRPIILEGELDQEHWTSRDGTERHRMVLNVARWAFYGDAGADTAAARAIGGDVRMPGGDLGADVAVARTIGSDKGAPGGGADTGPVAAQSSDGVDNVSTSDSQK